MGGAVFPPCIFLGITPKVLNQGHLPEVSQYLSLGLMGRAMLNKSLIQISVEGQGCVLSLLFDLRPNYGGSN